MRTFAASLALLIAFLIFAMAPAPAQEQPQHAERAADQVEQQPSPEQELAERSNEAAGREEEHDEHARFKYSPTVQFLARKTGMSPAAAYWVSVLLNFAVVAGIIAIFMKKKMPGAFRNRTSVIQKSLEEARRASEDANRRLSDIESRLSRIDSEIVGIQANTELQAKEEEARLRAAVEEERLKILQSAEQGITSAVNNARRELKAYAAELSVSLAEKRIKVDAATDAEIVRDFVEQLGTDGARGKAR
jgi:F-type H+-transporting ATPase subunit b